MHEVQRLMSAHLSRRTAITGAGAGLASATLAQAGLLQALAAQSESVHLPGCGHPGRGAEEIQ